MYNLYRLEPIAEAEAEEADSEEDPQPEIERRDRVSIGFSASMRPKAVIEESEDERSESVWRRFGVIDALVCLGLVNATLALWDYIMDIM
jgi:hypothetical protein